MFQCLLANRNAGVDLRRELIDKADPASQRRVKSLPRKKELLNSVAVTLRCIIKLIIFFMKEVEQIFPDK